MKTIQLHGKRSYHFKYLKTYLLAVLACFLMACQTVPNQVENTETQNSKAEIIKATEVPVQDIQIEETQDVDSQVEDIESVIIQDEVNVSKENQSPENQSQEKQVIETEIIEEPVIIDGASMNLARSDAISHQTVELIPLGEPEYPGLCPYRGHEGKYRCTNTDPIKHGKTQKSACAGEGLYLSRGSCYSCPKGYTRSWAIRKMTHPKACVKHQKGRNPKSAGTLVRKAYLGCPKGQFKHLGTCYSCADKTKRVHIAGIDKMTCAVEEPYHCNKGLVLHKSKPESFLNSLGNVTQSKNRMYCGLPFNLNSFAIEAVGNETNLLIAEAIVRFGIKMAQEDAVTEAKVSEFRTALKDKRLKDAYQVLTTFDEFAYLEQAAATGQQITITVGITIDGSVALGFNVENGLAIDVSQRKLIGYQARGMTYGFSAGGDIGISIGVWSGQFQTSYAQGIVTAFGEGGIGVWTDYYTPNRADGLNQPHLIGLTGSFGVGYSLEIGEYNEVYTELSTKINCTIQSGFRLNCP